MTILHTVLVYFLPPVLYLASGYVWGLTYESTWGRTKKRLKQSLDQTDAALEGWSRANNVIDKLRMNVQNTAQPSPRIGVTVVPQKRV